MPTTNELKTLDKAAEHFGGQSELARTLGVKHQNFAYWQKNGVPPIHCLKIHSLTAGAIKAYDLNRDIPSDIFAR